MTIGTDNKLHDAVTASGRVKAGAKGIGRFALDRLGEQCTMITYPGKVGYKWIVNWGDFETKSGKGAKKINEVFADLSKLENSSFKKDLLKEIKNKEVATIVNREKFAKGTMLKISGLRDEWNDDIVGKIYENLELLTPPDGSNKIKIYLINASEPKKYGLVPNNQFNDYDYKVTATYKKNSQHKIQIKIHRNEFDFSLIDPKLFEYPDMKEFPFDKRTFKKEHFELERTFKELLKGFEDKKKIANTLGDFEFTFYFLKHSLSEENREKFKYKDFLGDRGFWLRKFGGVKLYRDYFRVRPYGEIGTPSYDWLMLGERYGLNPAAVSRKGSRIRPNQIAGTVKFSRIGNDYLEDKSSREGLQENETFEFFKNILIGIIKVQEDDRSTVAYNLDELYKAQNQEEAALDETDAILEEAESEDETQEETRKKNRAVKRGYKAAKNKLIEKEEELSISRAMASAGILVASFSHEFHGIRFNLSARTDDLRESLEPVIDKTKLRRIKPEQSPYTIIDDIEKQDKRISEWIEFSVELTKKDRRKTKKLDLKDYFKNFNRLWLSVFKERGIKFSIQLNKQQDLSVRISELDLDTIFDNLITNSIEAFDRSGFHGKKNIGIGVVSKSGTVEIKYTDSGPGIPVEYKRITDIFNPFETSMKDDKGNDIGTGLGMWLVKSAITSNKGKANLIRPKNGFELGITFKIAKR
jgi:signal transduction histidine kinase